jgi:hypothetical protein
MTTDVIETRAHKVSEKSPEPAMVAGAINRKGCFPTSWSKSQDDWRKDMVIVYHAEQDAAEVKDLLAIGGYEA